MGIRGFDKYRPKLAADVFIAPGSFVIGRVEIGQFSSVWFNAVVRGDIDWIRIGSESNIQDNATVHVDRDKPTIIGNKVTIGHNAMLHGCTIEDGILIGIGSVILNGAVIGRDSIIAANSLVSPGKVIPPRSLVMGSPGKIVKTLSDEEIPVNGGYHQRYVDLARQYLSYESGNLA